MYYLVRLTLIQTCVCSFLAFLNDFNGDIPQNGKLDPSFSPKWGFIGPEMT